MGSDTSRTPRLSVSAFESSQDWPDVYCDGMKNVVTRSGPRASAAMAVVSAESMPPERPMTAPLKPLLST